MIFVILGSQKLQFNRLLEQVDKLVERANISESIFAQIGYSDYKPKNYNFKEFLDRDEFSAYIERSDIIITHGGTGTIVYSVKQGKKVIAVPRLREFGEHVDDHQIQIISEFEKIGFIKAAWKMEQLEELIVNIKNTVLKEYISNTNNIINSIEEFITKG